MKHETNISGYNRYHCSFQLKPVTVTINSQQCYHCLCVGKLEKKIHEVVTFVFDHHVS
jgi:hypothetical protein